MRLSRKFITDLIVGGLLSILFGGLLARQIMVSDVGNYASFMEFLSYPGNLLFCLLMSMFILASWLMRGINNRTVVFCWAIMVVTHSIIYYSIYDYFIHEFKSIYALSVAGVAATIPSVLFLRYRVVITVLLCEKIWKVGVLRNALGRYLSSAGATDFELDMCRALYVAFTVEFLYSLYLVTYALVNSIPFYASITRHMVNRNSWIPHDLYYVLLDIVAIIYILVIALHIYRENKEVDAFGYGTTELQRKAAGIRLLEKSRKTAKHDNGNGKRDA